MDKLWKLIRYGFSGGIATLTNLGVLFVCVQYFKLWYLISAVISFCVAVIVSYLLHKYITFRNYSREKMHKQFAIFFIFAAIMLEVNTLLMYILVDFLYVWYMLAQVISAFIVAILNFFVFNKFIFKNKEDSHLE